MVGSPLLKQGTPMLLKVKQPVLVISFLVFTSLLLISYYFSQHQECGASDFDPMSPVTKVYRGFDKDSTCKKALVICSYFSQNPKNCKIM